MSDSLTSSSTIAFDLEDSQRRWDVAFESCADHLSCEPLGVLGSEDVLLWTREYSCCLHLLQDIEFSAGSHRIMLDTSCLPLLESDCVLGLDFSTHVASALDPPPLYKAMSHFVKN